MANLKHLAILKKGVPEWNRWRDQNDMITPDLSKSDLTGFDLTEANLRITNLSEANLSGTVLFKANLSGADLIQTFLSDSDLRGANLSVTDLTQANLSFANLSNADLSGADLYATNLLQTKLYQADLSDASIGLTIFADVDLSNIKGLDTVYHEASSTIGIDTIYKSEGNIPDIFLRGCGVPDQMIEYTKSIRTKDKNKFSLFISYSHNDEDFAKRLTNDLQELGIRCWFAPYDLKVGDKIRSVIEESIRSHDKLLLILSENSIHSNWVEHEVETALSIENHHNMCVLYPVRIDEAVMESEIEWVNHLKRQRQIGDFTNWKTQDLYKHAFSRFVRDLTVSTAEDDRRRV